jgi:single-stranded DNA-binding protein
MIEAAFLGRISKPGELKTGQAGKSWAAAKIVIGTGDQVQWVRVVAFEDLARTLAAFKEGDRVYVEGGLTLDRWQDAAGAEKSGLTVRAWTVELAAIGRHRTPRPDQRQRDERAQRDWQAPRGASPTTDGRQGGYRLQRETDRGVPLNDPIPF